MTPEQNERAREVIQALNLPREVYRMYERQNGFQLAHADGKRPYKFGYVRFNQAGQCTVYAYREFGDPEQRFRRQLSSNDYIYTFDPDDDSAMQYASGHSGLHSREVDGKRLAATLE